MKKNVVRILLIIILASFLKVPLVEAYSGAGTQSNPYLITTCTELESLDNSGNSSYGNTYSLANDIDCQTDTHTGGALWNNGAGFKPIWDFQGTLDGRGHTISNLFINRPTETFVGLFGASNTASFFNLTLSNVNITGDAKVGSLIGEHGWGAIYNVGATGVVSGSTYVGGLVGRTTFSHSDIAVISKSYFSGRINNDNFGAGGLVGYAFYQLNIIDSYANVNIHGADAVGGLIGYSGDSVSNKSITRSYATGSISGSTSGQWSAAGGLIGYLSQDTVNVVDSFSNASVSGPLIKGSLFGAVVDQANLTISNTYFEDGLASIGTTTNATVNDGSAAVLGLDFAMQGSSLNTPLNKWNFNTVWKTEMFALPSLNKTGVYIAPDTVKNLEATPSIDSIDLTWGAPTSSGTFNVFYYVIQIKKHSETNWDDTSPSFNSDTLTTGNFDKVFSGLSPATQYDVRVNTITAYGGSGWNTIQVSTDAPSNINISSCQQLVNLTDYGSRFDNYNLINDIDCSGISIRPINWGGTFVGHFDGHNHKISNFVIDLPNENEIGLFSDVGNGAIIDNINFTSGSVRGVGPVGLIAPYGNDNTTINNIISNVNVTGEVDGSGNGGYSVGGLIGYESSTVSSSTFTNCVINGNVSGNNDVGGLIGGSGIYLNNPTTINISNNTINGKVTAVKNGESNYYNGSNFGGLIGNIEIATNNNNLTFNFVMSNNKISANSAVEADNNVGGLIGQSIIRNANSNIEYVINFGPNNSVLGNVSGKSTVVGGLVGSIYYEDGDSDGSADINFKQSFVTGNVSSVGDSVGGILGTFEASGDSANYRFNFDNVFYNGNITGNDNVGGLIGQAYDNGWNNKTLFINHSYAAGTIASHLSAGGLIGYQYVMGDISNSFAANTISGANDASTLIGSGQQTNELTLTNVYFDQYKNPEALPVVSQNFDGATAVNSDGESNDYFFNKSPFFSDIAAWDFDSIWKEKTNNYPVLQSSIPNYTLVYMAGSNGSIIGSSTQMIGEGENGSQVTATPNSDYHFVNWSDGVSTASRTETSVSADITVTANFAENSHSSGGGSSVVLPPAIGTGFSETTIPMNEVRDIGSINNNGINVLSYINGQANFAAPESSNNWQLANHNFKITDLNLATDIVNLTVSSKPQNITLKKGESKEVDLDGDKVNDVMVTFSNVFVNRAEVTIKSLVKNVITKPVTPVIPIVVVTPTKSVIFVFKKDLKLGAVNNDVKELQKYLNANGYIIAKSGAGSKGQETTKFGSATKAALIKFQKAKKINPASGLFGPLTRKIINK